MKKNNVPRSLSAKERKQLNKKETEKQDNLPCEEEQALQDNKSKKMMAFSIIAGVLGVILILVAVILPFVFNKKYINDTKKLDENGNPIYSYETKNPIAFIKLSNGMTLRAELWEKDCPIATSNFIYLAEIGFFDGTIIYDNTDGWIRMGGFTSDGSNRADDDEKFLSALKDREKYNLNKMGYRLKKDSNPLANKGREQGVLSFNYKYSATEFQFMANEQGNNNPVGNKSWENSSFGQILDEDLDNLISLADISSVDDKYYTSLDDDKNGKTIFTPPQHKGQYITIKKVDVKYLSKRKWKKFNFVEYFDGGKLHNWYVHSKRVVGDE